jgi:hypothetical protein
MTAWRARALRPLVVLALLGVGCRGGPTSNPTSSRSNPGAIEKTLVTKLPSDYVPQTLVFSQDGRAWAFVTKGEHGQRVVSSKYGASDVHSQTQKLMFAPKSDRLFYWTRELPTDPSVAPVVAMFADGKTIATEFVATGEMSFSEDGSRWVAAGAALGAEPGKLGDLSLFVDGVQIARARDMTLPATSNDGRHVAHLVKGDDGRVTLIVDGKSGQVFDPPTTECGAAAFNAAPSPDLPLRHIVKYLSDGSLLIVTRDPEGWGVYVDGRKLAGYTRATLDQADAACLRTSAIVPRLLRVAENAPAVFWWERVAGDADVWRVVRNGRPVDDVTCVEPWRHHPPEPSADGTHVVYACPMRRPDDGDAPEVFLIKDGLRYGPYDNMWGIAPTKDGAAVAYGAARGATERPWALYVNGEARRSRLASTWRPRLSEDASTLVWEVSVRDGDRGIFGIDDRTIGSFDEIFWGPEFEPGDRVAWIIKRGRKVTRVSVPLAMAHARGPHAIVVKSPMSSAQTPLPLRPMPAAQ